MDFMSENNDVCGIYMGFDNTEISIFIALLPFGTCMEIKASFRSTEGKKESR